MKIADINQLKISALLPSPKGVALALLEICRREDVPIAEIIKLVQTDPALSGRLIQRANTANHAARPVTSVAEAVSRIGLSTVRQLSLGFSLVDQSQKALAKNLITRSFGHIHC